MAEPQASSPQDLLSSLAYQTGGLGAIPQIQQSQYLAQALKSLQEGSARNISNKGALASNLMADAILQFSRNRNNQQLEQQIGQGMQGQVAANTSGTGLAPYPTAAPGPSAAPAAPASPPGGAMPAPSPQGPPAASGSGASALTAAAIQGGAPAVQARLSGSDFFNNFFVPHEGRLNRADANGSPSVYGLNEKANPDVTSSMTQAQAEPIFEQRYYDASGANNLPPALAAIHADTYALNPSWATQILAKSGGDPQQYMALRQQYMANDQARNPAVRPYAKAWANRNNDLMAYASQVGGQGNAQQPTGQIGGGPGASYQVASNGPTPGPPMNALGVPAATPQTQGGPFPPPPPPPGPSAGVPVGGAVPNAPQAGPINANTPPPIAQAMQAQQSQGPLSQGPKATPQEIALYQRLSAFPVGSAAWQQSQQLARNIQERQAPAKLPEGYGYNAQGQAQSATPFTDAPGGPNYFAQRGPNNELHITGNPAVAGPQAGQVLTGGGGPPGGPPAPLAAAPVPGTGLRPLVTPQERAAAGISPMDHAGYAADPSGHVVTQAPAAVPPSELGARQTAFNSSQEMQDYNKIRGSAQGFFNILNSAKGNNGIIGVTALNSLLQSYGVTPRGATAEDIEKKTGFSSQIAGAILQGLGKGGLPVDEYQNIATGIMGEVTARQQVAQQRMQSDSAYVHGLDPTFTSVPGEAVPPAPSAPSFAGFGPGAPGGSRIDPQAAAAELQRRGYRLVNGQWTK